MKNRTLKRPMFRKGGPAMEGIMTGIKPRKKFAEGDEVTTQSKNPNLSQIQNYINLGRQVIPRESGMSKLSDFLLEFGPALATNPSSGSIFTDLNQAAKKPAQSLIVKKQADRALDTQLALQGLKGLSKQSLIALEKKINLAIQSGRYGPADDPETRKKVTGLFLNKELQGVDRSGRYEAENRMDRVKAFTKGFADPATGYGVSLTTAEMMANIYVDKISKEKNLTKDFDINKPFMNPQGYQSKANGNLIIPSNELDEYIRNKQYSDLNGNYFLFTGKEFQPISSETGK